MNNSQNYLWWTREAREELAEAIGAMGLQRCKVCESPASALEVLPWPAAVHLGGSGDDKRTGNVLFMAAVRCESCGHAMLFDSEKLADLGTSSLREGRQQPD
jgi:hypothetical protein